MFVTRLLKLQYVIDITYTPKIDARSIKKKKIHVSLERASYYT